MNLVFETVACPLCHVDTAKHLLTNPDFGEQVAGRFTLVRCTGCGLYYQNPRPTPATIGLCYPDTYSAYTSQGLRARRRILAWITQRGMSRRVALLSQIVPGTRHTVRSLLDVGSGAGVFLEAAQQIGGWQLAGLEPNAQAAKATQQRTGIPVFHGTLEQAEYAAESFDAITMWDVLEHLHDPVASLGEIHRILKPGGALLLRVPNAASYTRILAGRYWAGYDLPRHITVFDPRTLQQALQKAGFDHIDTQYTSGSYLLLIHSLRFALASWPVSAQYAERIYRLLYNPLVRGLLGTPFILADRIGGGGALEVLVRKA